VTLSSFEISLLIMAVPTAYSIGIYTPRRIKFLAVLRDADTDTWIAINCPDGIIEKPGDDRYDTRRTLRRYLWKREYLSRQNADLTSAADNLRVSSMIAICIGAPAMALAFWCAHTSTTLTI
jgi:hypothetical protein